MPRPNVAVLVLPNYEDAVRYASRAVADVSGSVRGWDIYALIGDEAVREAFEGAVRTYDPSLIVGAGHGKPSEYIGQYREPVLWECSDGLVRGRVIYLLSCSTGKVLGPDLVSKGAEAFIGYVEDFMFISSGGADPLTDPVARYFFEPVAKLLTDIFTGASVGDAVSNSKTLYNSLIDHLSRLGVSWAPAVIALLIHDRDALTALGDTSAVAATYPATVVARAPDLGALVAAVVTSAITYLATGNPVASAMVGLGFGALRKLRGTAPS